MKCFCRSAVVFIFFLVLFFAPGRVFAERPSEGIGKWLQEKGFFSGYIDSSLKGQDDMQAIPIGMRFGFDLKPFLEKFDIQPKGMVELVYEPFISAITEPRDNVELGCGIMLKYSYPLTQKLYPFVELGTGLYYMTINTYEQSTQFNFVNQGGGGIAYFIRPDLAVSLTYRRRHISNCSIEKPNGGIEANVYLAGVSYYF